MMGYQGDSLYDKEIAAFQKEQMRLLAKDKELSHMESAQLNTLLERRRGWHERDAEVARVKERVVAHFQQIAYGGLEMETVKEIARLALKESDE